MRDVCEAVRAYLERASGIPTVCAPLLTPGVYPIQTVEVCEEGAALCAGGRQAEHDYRVTVVAARDRARSDRNALAASLVPVLLRGIPAELPGGEAGVTERRVLAPQDIRAEGDTLCFHLRLCRAVPQDAESGAGAETMGALHWRAE